MQENSCKHLKYCGSCTLEMPYEGQIDFKKNFVKEHFKDFYNGEILFFRSPISKFRSRAEFSLYHNDNSLSYAMRGTDGGYLKIDKCSIVDEKIAVIMPVLLDLLKENPNLKAKVFGVEFITTRDEILVILLYHKDVSTIIQELTWLQNKLKVGLIARSRGKKLLFGSSILNEKLFIKGKSYHYIFGDGAFVQPNRNINENMISWVLDHVVDCKDLLELYCGHGNFTIPLSFKFNKVLATEISKASINSALKNCELNSANNIKFTRLSAEELMEAFLFKRDFRRLQDIDLRSYDFSHILVDPPRSGCDKSVLDFIRNYENIIYISCNPLTLKENLKLLCKTHSVDKFAIFDQFVHTNHIECAVVLKKY
ncbi:tRNA (uracil-5-)-methyltransferase [Campylobacter fetus subsp. testudinum]|uniref:tRNA (uridine(54)-C5)-methyltransferase TrmA n=1 Tax=Campylobacter fetus TaxID=196 RepID=UPI0008187576|nr:tRNA (uridine(54)-C5)-methyltransferase TrmA [Campylobacter fetus]AVK81230.1 tRNA (uridine(54)-C5)-methyltransferase TrmA [Campylobacter fetus subsp. testudinum]EAK0825971.1 tRNA (uridine(54)-C5)-methyltransferase TrmA [Campylobacter fetus]MPB71596.1 tRNA (uridine(54)-C5)-methyltransferase TrmA [Campylobacter fetus]MPB77353.1 tRNA (uridine(54)-C5)-methyltransferase TrmA [Campylobacter fetus]OCR87474.1 tRNA (uracil-5-)-methyltransferase [Campylobacter fetus subsp. testudinum]